MPPLPEMKGAPRQNRIFDSENDLLGIAIAQLHTTCVARTKAIKAIVASSGKTQESLKIGSGDGGVRGSPPVPPWRPQ